MTDDYYSEMLEVIKKVGLLEAVCDLVSNMLISPLLE